MFELALTFLGLVLGGVVLGVPYLLVSHSRLKARVAALEHRLFERERAARPAPAQPEAANPWRAPVDASPAPPPETGAIPPRPETEEKAHAGENDAAPPAFVFRRELLGGLSRWLRENWVLAIGSASLAFAGLFLVQYGVEHGLLTPFWRVTGAAILGAALIAGGEAIRRRYGDDAENSVKYLPSALSGAGLITLFIAVLAARAMYGLLEPRPTLAALCLVSVLAVTIGWLYGPLLSALGIVGATAAPFLVGGDSNASWVLFFYFALIAAVGLGIDTIKRWAWVSVIALIASLAASFTLFLARPDDLSFLSGVVPIAFAAIVVPERSLLPQHAGASFFDLLGSHAGRRRFPEFPTRLSLAGVGAVTAAALLVALNADKAEQVYLAFGTLTLALVATLIWMRRAPALFDHTLLPGLAILALLALEPFAHGPLYSAFLDAVNRPPETPLPATAWILTAIGAAGTCLAFLRMRQAVEENRAPGGQEVVFWALASATYAPMTVLAMEFFWEPARVVGLAPWALVVIAIATMMTFLAERAAKLNETPQRPLLVALFAIAALTLIALALFMLLTKTALTLALAVMVLLTALIDRRFDLPALALFLQIGVGVISYRLVVDPGIYWATQVAGSGEVALAYLGTIGVLIPALLVARPARPKTALIVESAIFTLGAVFLSVMLNRMFQGLLGAEHAEAGLTAAVWAATLVNQLYRMKGGSRFGRLIRIGLATIYALVLCGSLFAGFFVTNPLFANYFGPRQFVGGTPVLDSLFAAYAPLACVFAVAALKLTHLGAKVRIGFAVVASALMAWYAALEIRRLWRGVDLTVPGVTDPELYSYTVALLFSSVALLMAAFWRRSNALRKLAMVGVALTVAKVFAIDMSGLTGLIRVVSFMGLGLALVGLAWLNRVMAAQWERN